MKVLVTGADGFIGRNLRQHLAELHIDVVPFLSSSDKASLAESLRGVECVVHLAGANRPRDPDDFSRVNAAFTQLLCEHTVRESQRSGRRIPILFTSSTQAGSSDGPYAQSKRAGERAIAEAGAAGLPVHIFRLPNVFGKWSRPNYNSVVATFCHNVARDLPLDIHAPSSPLTLVYVDDVVARFVKLIQGAAAQVDDAGFEIIGPQYHLTVGQLADQIREFRRSRLTLTVDRVGGGLARALHATYLSFLPPDSFSYPLTEHLDARGKFVEVLKTADSGQFSYFTAGPGITRGGHYHHSKTEKFLVISGQARFRFRHIQDGTAYELMTSGERPEVVETVPGWAHDITNIGDDELLVMLWANEVFDRSRPDTYMHAT